MPENKRNPIVDIAKGVGIVLVVLGHNGVVETEAKEMTRIIFSFHMPLFILISGVYLKTTYSFREILTIKTVSLLKPYSSMMLFAGMLLVLQGMVDGTRYAWGMLYATGESIGGGAHSTLIPLWFLPSLYLGLLFSWAILRLVARSRYRELLTLATALLSLLIGVGYLEAFWHLEIPAPLYGVIVPYGVWQLPGLPFGADLVPIFCAFILLGYLLREKIKIMTFNGLIFFSSLTVFTMLHCLFDYSIDLNRRYFDNFLVSIIQIACGIYIAFALSAIFSSVRYVGSALQYIGSASLIILIFHQPLQYWVLTLFSDNHEPLIYLSGTMAFLIGLGIPMVIFELMKRYSLLAAPFLPLGAIGNRT